MLTPRAADLDYYDYLADEAAAREATELGPVCAGCGRHTHHEHREVAVDEVYCRHCCAALALFVADEMIAEARV